MPHPAAQRLGIRRNDFLGNHELLRQARVALETVGHDEGMDAGRQRGFVVAVLVAHRVGARRIDVELLARRLVVRRLAFAQRQDVQEIQPPDVQVVARKQARQRDGRIVADVARDHADADARRFDQVADQLLHAGIQARLLAVHVGERVQQLPAQALAHMLGQIARKLLDAAQILEKIAALLEALQIAEIQAVLGEGRADGRKGVDHRAVGVDDDEAVRAAVHAFTGVV